MTDPFFALSGYDAMAGANAHEANRPQRFPVPSLLRSLLSEHLDPGYAAAAAARTQSGLPGRRAARWAWQALAALLVATVFAAAVAQARSVAPGVNAARDAGLATVRSAKSATEDLVSRRDTLAAQVDELQHRQLKDDAEGQRLLTRLDQVALPAADSRVIGPGLTITVTDPGVSRNLSDVSKRRVAGSQQIILDRDLQLVVNSLWAAGAEAIAIDNVRIGPNVTIRQAGGAILVDNAPISSPYTILAIGPPRPMQNVFDRSSGLHRLRLLEVSYGVGVTVSAGDGLALPAGTIREVKFAEPGGPP